MFHLKSIVRTDSKSADQNLLNTDLSICHFMARPTKSSDNDCTLDCLSNSKQKSTLAKYEDLNCPTPPHSKNQSHSAGKSEPLKCKSQLRTVVVRTCRLQYIGDSWAPLPRLSHIVCALHSSRSYISLTENKYNPGLSVFHTSLHSTPPRQAFGNTYAAQGAWGQ